MMASSNHPLPAPPGQQQQWSQQQPQRPINQRQRAKSSFSFRSSNSHKSNGSAGKIDYTESHDEKEAKRLHTKADPSMALSEAEPATVANQEKSSLAPIRAIQHRDGQGNPIADPDRSNPTRSRWERPLDTIRAFEAAIDGNYHRHSYMRTDSQDTASNHNRRTSYYGGTQVTTDERPRYPQNGYYSRTQSYRPDSTYQQDGKANGMTRQDNYFNGHEAGPSNGYYPNRARYPRSASEPHFNNGQGGVYPSPGGQQSYETVTTASGSGSSADAAGYSTDPSSENSSVDRIAPLPQKEPMETYGFSGFGDEPQYAPPGSGLREQYIPNGAQRQGIGHPDHNQAPPPLPRKQSTGPKVPIKLGKVNSNKKQPYDAQRPAAGEKRKSWFGKRFSKA